MAKAIAISDYEAAAKRRLPLFLREYFDGGAGDERTLARNAADLAAVLLRQRVLRDVSAIDTSTRLFGAEIAAPIVLAPVGLAGLAWRRGEAVAARAATTLGVPFCLSTVSICPIEEVRGTSELPIWFQLYIMRDRGFLNAMVERAWAVGCRVLVLTVDMPMPGNRRRDAHSGLSGGNTKLLAARRFAQALRKPQWALDVGLFGRPHVLGNLAPLLGRKTGLEDFIGWINANFDPTVTFEDVAALRKNWRGRLVVKGVLDPQDADTLRQIGVDGLVVSNHGGRQLDGAPSTALALPAIRDRIGEACTLLVDGGVRSGADILRFLALGADATMIGRAWIYALAAGGGPSVAHALTLLVRELRLAMGLTGCRSVGHVGTNILYGSRPLGT
jgi:L-lactate dehydrogenase (cytochrome)